MWIVPIVIILVPAGFATYVLVNKTQSSGADASFTYCGCGGCGGQAPVIEEIKDKDQFDKLKRELIKPSDLDCTAVGCSICTEYRLVAT